MTIRLRTDDLEPGLWITLRNRLRAESSWSSDEMFERFLSDSGRFRHGIASGTPLRVVSIDLPFVHVLVLNADEDHDRRATINLDVDHVVRCDEEAIHRLVNAVQEDRLRSESEGRRRSIVEGQNEGARLAAQHALLSSRGLELDN